MNRPSNDVDRLASSIEELRIEYERFFNGAQPTPPLELRDRLQRRLRHVREQPLLSALDRFRLSQLEARFNSLTELNNRRLKEKEEGRAHPVFDLAPKRPRFDAEEGIVLGPRPAQDAVEALYQGLYRKSGDLNYDIESFRRYLDRQLESIREKTGCQEVCFRLVQEDGQTKLKARPVRA
ncbi:MAG TPA: MXAN_5187 C-terminal domain-containing protein [Thermoanaerobaculia bacterium]|nr:MXAN_5187 C-terminal domain-containing protein [Thermoanaerobaculia bacterium]